MTCKNCGFKNPDGAQHCTMCGSKKDELAYPDRTPKDMSVPPPPAPSEPKPVVN